VTNTTNTCCDATNVCHGHCNQGRPNNHHGIHFGGPWGIHDGSWGGLGPHEVLGPHGIFGRGGLFGNSTSYWGWFTEEADTKKVAKSFDERKTTVNAKRLDASAIKCMRKPVENGKMLNGSADKRVKRPTDNPVVVLPSMTTIASTWTDLGVGLPSSLGDNSTKRGSGLRPLYETTLLKVFMYTETGPGLHTPHETAVRKAFECMATATPRLLYSRVLFEKAFESTQMIALHLNCKMGAVRASECTQMILLPLQCKILVGKAFECIRLLSILHRTALKAGITQMVS